MVNYPSELVTGDSPLPLQPAIRAIVHQVYRQVALLGLTTFHRRGNAITVALYKDRHRELWNKCTNCGELVFKQALDVTPILVQIVITILRCLLMVVFAIYLIQRQYSISTRLQIDKQLLDTIGMTDLVHQNRFPDESQWLISAGEGTISNCPAVLAVAAPYAIPQRVHFVTLLVAIRTALEKKLPFITVFPSDALAQKRSNPPEQPELSPTEITYLTIEMDNLSQARLHRLRFSPIKIVRRDS